jgi:hypothetical protein
VAATAVLWAAGHGKREVNVGSATLKTRLGNMLTPGLLDRLAVDDQAKPFSVMLWATMHKSLVTGVLGGGLALAAPARRRGSADDAAFTG